MSRSIITSTLAALLLAAPAFAVDVPTGTDTKLKVYGKVWATAEYFMNSSQGLHNDPYDSGQIKDARGADKQLLLSGRLSRFGFQTVTPSSNMGDVTAKIETDFKGAGNTLRLRHGFLTVGGWTVGQTWSTWFDLDAGADTVDFAGPIGAAPFDQSRVAMIRYSFAINKQNSLTFALENNGGKGDGSTGGDSADGKYPNIVGVYKFAGDWGHVAVSAVAQNFASFKNENSGSTVLVAAPSAEVRYDKWSANFQVSGNVNIAKDNLYFSAYTGSGAGPYGTGTTNTQFFNSATKEIEFLKATGVMVGYTHQWTDAVRSNIVLSGVSFKEDKPFTAPDPTTGVAVAKTYADLFINTFVAITKSLDFGAEYVYQSAKAFNNGWLDSKGQLTDKNNFSKFEIQLVSKF